MAGPKDAGTLFPLPVPPEGSVVINAQCTMRTQEGHRVIVGSGIVLANYAQEDRTAEAYWMVNLVEQGWAGQGDVARAFGCSTRTLRRHQDRFEERGMAALGHGRGYPAWRTRLGASRRRLVHRLKAEGHFNREIARRIGVSEVAVRKYLKRLGWKERTSRQAHLPFGEAPGANPKLSGFPKSAPEPSSAEAGGSDPNLSAFSADGEESIPISLDTDPADRRLDRWLAYVGLLEDAAPLFRSGHGIPRVGVLLAIPALLESGVLESARKIYGSIGPAFYGLRTSLVALLLFALLRIKRPEGLKEHDPDDLGRILGLDRAPEVKTLRRKLARLASYGRAAQFGHALAERRVTDQGKAMGFLYVDGHVRVYHGQHTLPKAHVARMRLAMPATSDYWVNDMRGDPLFVVTAEANAGMVKMLPVVLAEVRALVGERRVTIVFDRGGYSPKLFVDLMAAGFDILTYRKGRFPRVPRSCFDTHTAVLDGKKVSYLLADRKVRLLGGKLTLRQVTRLSADGCHQTPILTSRGELPAIEVAFRMFEPTFRTSVT